MGDSVVPGFEQEAVTKKLVSPFFRDIKFDSLGDSQVRRDKVVLGQIGHQTGTKGGSFDHFPVYADKAPVAFQRPENNVQQGRFPASVMSEQGNDVSRTATEVDVRQYSLLLKALYDTVDLQTSTHKRMI